MVFENNLDNQNHAIVFKIISINKPQTFKIAMTMQERISALTNLMKGEEVCTPAVCSLNIKEIIVIIIV